MILWWIFACHFGTFYINVELKDATIYVYALSTTLEARTLTITPPMQLLPNRKITKPAILGSCTLKLRPEPSCKYQLYSLSLLMQFLDCVPKTRNLSSLVIIGGVKWAIRCSDWIIFYINCLIVSFSLRQRAIYMQSKLRSYN